MASYYYSDADKLKYLRQFLKGYDTRDGWKIGRNGNILLPDEMTSKQAKKAWLKFEHDYDNIRAATSVPYKISKIRTPEKRNLINKVSGMGQYADRMKVTVIRAETQNSKFNKAFKNGYSVIENGFQKFYFNYDIVELIKRGADYFKELISVIPYYMESQFKMLSSFGNVEFNGTFQSVEMLAQEILMLSNKYYQDVEKGRFMYSFVTYSYHPDMVDIDELEKHLNEFMEVRTRKKKKKKFSNRDVEY